jgi:predicted ArsR family transcriptional regulator
LIERLNLPAEVSTQEAAAILGCCKHTVLQYLEEGLLEWRNIAPPSSNRPIYRFTLRSVTELRLAYQRGSARPPQASKATEKKRRSKPAFDYKPQHLRRKKRAAQ